MIQRPCGHEGPPSPSANSSRLLYEALLYPLQTGGRLREVMPLPRVAQPGSHRAEDSVSDNKNRHPLPTANRPPPTKPAGHRSQVSTGGRQRLVGSHVPCTVLFSPAQATFPASTTTDSPAEVPRPPPRAPHNSKGPGDSATRSPMSRVPPDPGHPGP